jgi:hypothetical protein
MRYKFTLTFDSVARAPRPETELVERAVINTAFPDFGSRAAATTKAEFSDCLCPA